MPSGVAWMAVLVSGYIAAGATAKLFARADAATALDVTLGRVWPWSRRSLARTIGTTELIVALLAAMPTSLQRVGLMFQVALVAAFVGVLVYARRIDAPCGCFARREERPTAAHLGVAVGVALAAVALIMWPRAGRAGLFGLGVGMLVGALLVIQARDTRSPAFSESDSSVELLLTRRGVVVGGLVGFAAFVAATIFGWQRSSRAFAGVAERTITPRLPSDGERAAAMVSIPLSQLRAEHGIDASAILWDQALAYEDRWPDRTIVSIVAPIADSPLSLVRAEAGDGVPVETAGLLQADRTGWIRVDEETFTLDKGKLVGVPSGFATTSSEFHSDFADCLGNVAPAAIEICCSLCGLTVLISGPVAAACCGGCGIGAIIGCLWVSIK